MRYYIITGEASGDMHGANLIKALKAKDPDAQFRCWGGDKMAEEGASLAMHIRDLAFMGFKEVLVNLPTIFNYIRFCKQDIQQFNPAVIILIDYPGFNLRIAKFAKKKGYQVAYYISPQVWAWKPSRVKTIKKYVDRMLVILPFEKAFYQRWHYEVSFVGHPLLDVVNAFEPDPEFHEKNNLPDKPLIALIPGSRRQEIEEILPEMVKLMPFYPDYHFVVAAAPGIETDFYKSRLPADQATVIVNQTYNLMYYAKAGLITSGTATLEAALFELPEVVCYKGSKLSYQIARRLVNVKYISLANLVMDKMIVQELIQENCNVENLNAALNPLLNDESTRKKLFHEYRALKKALGDSGASERAADEIYQSITPGN